jgi:hypothetical protein
MVEHKSEVLLVFHPWHHKKEKPKRILMKMGSKTEGERIQRNYSKQEVENNQ